MRKRLFDLAIIILFAPVWILVLASMYWAIWVCDGRPVLYCSNRRVGKDRTIRLLKFRTMARGADKIVNRDTVRVEGVCFLNISQDSPLYTRIGRVFERYHLNELPQILHVMMGAMSLVGCRPLPENVIKALTERYPQTEQRFSTKAGLSGPVQLVGREAISDEDRLMLEIEYSHMCLTAYSMLTDFLILWYTMLIVFKVVRPFSVSEALALVGRYPEPVAGSAHEYMQAAECPAETRKAIS